MTLRTKSKRQSNVTYSCIELLFADRAKVLIPRLRRPAHSPGVFLADAILVPVSSAVNMNLAPCAEDFCEVALGVTATAPIAAQGSTILTESNPQFMAAVDDDDEDEDEDDSYDDDLDGEDDEDLDDEDDEEYDDDLDDEDGELDDDYDDEDEDDEDEDDE